MTRVTSTRPRRRQKVTEKYRGVGRRPNGKLYFNTRFCCGLFTTRLFTNSLESEKEGAVVHDILKLYEPIFKAGNRVRDGERTEVGLELNFPVMSRSLRLEFLPTELLELSLELLTEDESKSKLMEFKSKLMEIVIRQAHEALKTNQEIQSAGTQGANSRSVHFETAAVTPSLASRGSVSSPPVCGSEEIQILGDKLSEANVIAQDLLDFQVRERQDSEYKSKSLNESRGEISLPETVTPNHWDISCAPRAPIKISHGLNNPILEHSECNQLQKKVEDANFEFITDRLTNSGNQRTGRLREEEPRLITPIFELPETVD